MEVKIENLRNKNDLEKLAVGYCELYNNSVLQEKWTPETAHSLLEYFYNLCPLLFQVAYYNDEPVGAIMSGVKPWWDGIHIEDTEVFVLNGYHKHGIATKLYKEHFQLAIKEYNATIMEAHTYFDKNGFTLKWYKKLGFETVDDWAIISGDIKEILKNLND